MMRRLRTLVLALGLLAIGAPVSSAAAHQTAQDAALARGIAKALAAHGFTGLGTGIAVADLATGDVIYQRNGARPLLPASTEKLFTTVGALTTLRPDFRFAMDVFAHEPLPPDSPLRCVPRFLQRRMPPTCACKRACPRSNPHGSSVTRARRLSAVSISRLRRRNTRSVRIRNPCVLTWRTSVSRTRWPCA